MSEFVLPLSHVSIGLALAPLVRRGLITEREWFALVGIRYTQMVARG